MTAAALPHPPAMLLAAGRGERMRPLTDSTPKPLLRVRGKPLMQWPLEALSRGGCPRVVINAAWLSEQVVSAFGSHFHPQPAYSLPEQLANQEHLHAAMALQYSNEGLDFGGALETAGGIARALPLLCPEAEEGRGKDVFWALAADIYAPDFVFAQADVERLLHSTALGHIWLVPNPPQYPQGDFGLDVAQGLALNLHAPHPGPRYTFSTIGLYRSALFAPPFCDIPTGNPHGVRAALAPVLRAAMDQGRISASLYDGRWVDVGTPERLAQLNLEI